MCDTVLVSAQQERLILSGQLHLLPHRMWPFPCAMDSRESPDLWCSVLQHLGAWYGSCGSPICPQSFLAPCCPSLWLCFQELGTRRRQLMRAPRASCPPAKPCSWVLWGEASCVSSLLSAQCPPSAFPEEPGFPCLPACWLVAGGLRAGQGLLLSVGRLGGRRLLRRLLWD